MKRIIIILFAVITLSLTSCSVGNYSVVSGNADKASVCFTSTEKFDITVNIDGTTYDVKTIKDKKYKSGRNIKKTAQQEITLSPGRHKVIITKDGVEIYNQEIFVSNTEVKVIEL